MLGERLALLKENKGLKFVDSRGNPVSASAIDISQSQPTFGSSTSAATENSDRSSGFKPTRVLFVRGLPADATEQDVARIFSVYGTVE